MLVRIWCAIALLSGLASAPAWADGTKPSPAQLQRAKKAFADGKKLHDAGKLTEAIEKFKTSYELSNNPLLLYNIGLTMQEAGSDDLAVIYYRKFLAEAPADAAQRGDVTDRIAAITRKLTPEPPPVPEALPPPVTPAPPADDSATLGHHPIETAPPDKPLDVTALVAPDAGLTIVLFSRAAGEPGFLATPMIRRQRELVGRIPAARMTGASVQYYLEARDAAGTVVARSGKATSPNVIALDVTASTQFYPDIADPPVARSGDREDPLHRSPVAETDAGPRPFGVARWTATAATGVGLGLGITMYFLAKDHAHAIEDDATGCGTPPCQTFDAFDRNLQHTGKLEQTIANVALVGGAAAAVVAGYFWYRALTDHPDHPDASKLARTWQLAPAISDGYTGAAAVVGF